MIHRKFDGLKFKRTYIGGSKQQELKSFQKVQGTKEDNSECNWLEYRRMLMHYLDDTLNIVLSWKRVSGIFRIVLALLALLISFANPIVSLFILGLSAFFHFTYIVLKNKENRLLSEYDFSLDIINQETGLVLSKN